MSEKVSVWAHKHSHRGEWFVDEKPHETKVAGTQRPATLVVFSEGMPENVYTQTEILAMMNELEEFQWFTTGQLEYLRSKGIRI